MSFACLFSFGQPTCNLSPVLLLGIKQFPPSGEGHLTQLDFPKAVTFELKHEEQMILSSCWVWQGWRLV